MRIVKTIAKVHISWSEIKEFIEMEEGSIAYDSELGRYLENLEKGGLVKLC
ncbi:MAG: hypothetical protein N3D12_06425 [Candidatus Methanomethyliaceae archaeon]|nr:hypothetical protein [Candidatus Methanomethyliaceae archaeon]